MGTLQPLLLSCPCFHHVDSKAFTRNFGLCIIHLSLSFCHLFPSWYGCVCLHFLGKKVFFSLLRNLHIVWTNGTSTCSQGFKVPVLPWGNAMLAVFSVGKPTSGTWTYSLPLLPFFLIKTKHFQSWSYHSWGSEYTYVKIFHECACVYIAEGVWAHISLLIWNSSLIYR